MLKDRLAGGIVGDPDYRHFHVVPNHHPQGLAYRIPL
jgi:hypothetical protein